MSKNKANAIIHRSTEGTILGAAVWIPGEIISPLIDHTQKEIEIAFEGDIMIIGKRANVK